MCDCAAQITSIATALNGIRSEIDEELTELATIIGVTLNGTIATCCALLVAEIRVQGESLVETIEKTEECKIKAVNYQTDILGTQETTQTALYHCDLERKDKVDFISGLLAAALVLLYNEYYDKYEEIIEWRDEIGNLIKDCMVKDMDHYKDVIMGNMISAIDSIIGFSKVTVEYGACVDDYNHYCNDIADAAFGTIRDIKKKTCWDNKLDCNHIAGDIKGWAKAASSSAVDSNFRFNEGRVPRRYDQISSALSSAHKATFNLPNFDYLAFSNAANIAGTLASVYAGIANSIGGAIGYFGGNFLNSVGGVGFGGGSS